jgi:hypothetical protein
LDASDSTVFMAVRPPEWFCMPIGEIATLRDSQESSCAAESVGAISPSASKTYSQSTRSPPRGGLSHAQPGAAASRAASANHVRILLNMPPL